MLSLELPHFLKPALSQGHPWVYRDHVPRHFRAKAGAWVEINAGNWKGYALCDATSPIALRVFSTRQMPDQDWVQARLQQAWELRAPLREQESTAYRLLFGEGDGIPGLTIDLYGEYAVIATYADSLETLLAWIVTGLQAIVPLKGIVQRGGEENTVGKIRLLWGELPPRDLIVLEHGLHFRANLYEGQKTGLFLDHRENRHYIEEIADNQRVLNLFAYSGAFSLYAARGGASHITSVDIAPNAADDARANFTLNGFDPAAHEFIVADVFDYLEQCRIRKRKFDVVICDPPSFAHTKAQLPQAIKAYTRLNAMGLRTVSDGGWYAAASCTSQVSPEAFRDLLADSARQAGVRFQIIHDIGQPFDHPVMAAHKEGRYLKFVVGRVRGLW
jgi:23S rRNA (cytosine1962-C5)-methyltransferase